jgi:serine/threonine protein kinase
LKGKGVSVTKTITLAELLSHLASAQDDQTMQEAYDHLSLLTATNIKQVLGVLLDPISFPDLASFAEGLKKAYQRVNKERVTRNAEKLLGVIGLVSFMLELLRIAEQLSQDASSPELRWSQTLLKEPTVLYWFKQVYAPDASLTTLQNSATKQQEEANLNLAKEHWQHLDFESLELYRVGTTSFILRCRVSVLVGEKLVLKCLLFPYSRVPAIAETTQNYALRYPVDSTPAVARVLSSTNKWILMDLVEGSNLREFLQKRRVAEGQEPPLLRIDLLTTIGKPLLDLLHNLARAGLRHEDLTPSNIMVQEKPDGSVDKIVLIDLGRNYLYTRHVGLEAGREAIFVAPEIKADQHAEETSDLYSFGMILIELADPIGVQGATIPESLYQYAPHLARFIEDLIDAKPEHRRLIFPITDRNNPYADLCHLFEDLLKVLPSAQEMKPGRSFWIHQLLALCYPARQRKHAWDLWRMTHTPSTHPEIARYAGWLYFWLFISMVNAWVIFTVSLLWGARDFGMNFFPTSVTIVQTLLPGCRGTCVPLLDKLQAPGYTFGVSNLPMRLVGLSIGLVQAAYYPNILAGLTTRPMSGKLARATEVFLRLQAIVALPLILAGNLIQPEWWLALLILGFPTPALVNTLSYRLAIRTLKKARGVLSTVPLVEDQSLKNFGQWGPTLFYYIGMLFILWILLQYRLLHDALFYAIITFAIHVLILCISKSIILAPSVRGSLCRAFTIGERLEALAQKSRKTMLAP